MLSKKQLGWVIIGLVFAIISIVTGTCETIMNSEDAEYEETESR